MVKSKKSIYKDSTMDFDFENLQIISNFAFANIRFKENDTGNNTY